jgi:hypothetical protein
MLGSLLCLRASRRGAHLPELVMAGLLDRFAGRVIRGGIPRAFRLLDEWSGRNLERLGASHPSMLTWTRSACTILENSGHRPRKGKGT